MRAVSGPKGKVGCTMCQAHSLMPKCHRRPGRLRLGRAAHCHRRAPGHRRRSTRRRGRCLRRRCHARAGPDGGRRAARTPGAVHCIRRGGAAGAGRLHAPFRIAGVRPRSPGVAALGRGRMVSLDRVGVLATNVPLATGGTGTTQVMDALSAAAEQAGIPSARSQDNRASDHWSFEKADIPSARVGSVPYAAYHSAADLPEVVDIAQLNRVGALSGGGYRRSDRGSRFGHAFDRGSIRTVAGPSGDEHGQCQQRTLPIAHRWNPSGLRGRREPDLQGRSLAGRDPEIAHVPMCWSGATVRLFQGRQVGAHQAQVVLALGVIGQSLDRVEDRGRDAEVDCQRLRHVGAD